MVTKTCMSWHGKLSQMWQLEANEKQHELQIDIGVNKWNSYHAQFNLIEIVCIAYHGETITPLELNSLMVFEGKQMHF